MTEPYYQDESIRLYHCDCLEIDASRARRPGLRGRVMTDHCPGCPFKGCDGCAYQGSPPPNAKED